MFGRACCKSLVSLALGLTFIAPLPSPNFAYAQTQPPSCLGVATLENGKIALVNTCPNAVWFSLCYNDPVDKGSYALNQSTAKNYPACENKESIQGMLGTRAGSNFEAVGSPDKLKNGFAWVECQHLEGGPLGFNNTTTRYDPRSKRQSIMCANRAVFSQSYSSIGARSVAAPALPASRPHSSAGSTATASSSVGAQSSGLFRKCISLSEYPNPTRGIPIWGIRNKCSSRLEVAFCLKKSQEYAGDSWLCSRREVMRKTLPSDTALDFNMALLDGETVQMFGFACSTGSPRTHFDGSQLISDGC